MIAPTLEEIVKETLKGNGIESDDLIDLKISIEPDESTFAPILFVDVVDKKGNKIEVRNQLSAELVQDIRSAGNSFDDDIKQLNRDIRLNRLLNEDT